MKILMINIVLLSSLSVMATTGAIEKNAREKKLESAMENFPPIKEHHQNMKELLSNKLNPEGIVVVENAIKAGFFIEQKDKEQALKAINSAAKIAENAKALLKNEDLLMVEYNVEVINQAPYEIKEIKLIKKDINLAYRLENFPKTRALMSILESELRMQTFYISLNHYLDSLNNLKALVTDKKFLEAQVSINELLGTVVAEEYGIPLPFIEAQSALIAAERLQEFDLDQAKINIKEAQYQLDRAQALGYVTGEEDDFKMLNDKMKSIKKDMLRKQFKMPDFNIMKGQLIAFIKKQMVPRNKPTMSLLRKR